MLISLLYDSPPTTTPNQREIQRKVGEIEQVFIKSVAKHAPAREVSGCEWTSR